MRRMGVKKKQEERGKKKWNKKLIEKMEPVTVVAAGWRSHGNRL